MITIEIPERDLIFNMPEHLGECSAIEYVLMSRLIYQYQTGEIDYPKFRVLAVYHLLNLKPGNELPIKQQEEEKNANIYRLSELIDSFFNVQEDKLMIRQEYQHNPLPVIDCGINKFYGPADYFRGVKFGQYVDALQLYGTYNETQDIELLYHLCGVFYKPKKAKYNPDKIETIAEKLHNTDFGFIYGFYLFFSSFQHYLTSAKIYYQGREIDLSILFQKSAASGSPSGLPSIGMKSTAYDLAESGILGSLKEVNQTDMWEVFFLMYDIMRKDKDQQIKSKQKS